MVDGVSQRPLDADVSTVGAQDASHVPATFPLVAAPNTLGPISRATAHHRQAEEAAGELAMGEMRLGERQDLAIPGHREDGPLAAWNSLPPRLVQLAGVPLLGLDIPAGTVDDL